MYTLPLTTSNLITTTSKTRHNSNANSFTRTLKPLQPRKHSTIQAAAATPLCVAESQPVFGSQSAPEASRRSLVLSGTSLLALDAFNVLPAAAEGDDLAIFYGAANPPATPGKVGGTTRAKARYSFLVPESWTEEVISKVEKGTNGTDCRFVSSARKKEKVFLLTLSNEGGSSRFTMDQPPIPLLKSLTGSIGPFQDALADGELSAELVEKDDGKQYFEYKLEGASSYLVRITVTDGRVFGLFINAPAKNFKADFQLIRSIADSFETYANSDN